MLRYLISIGSIFGIIILEIGGNLLNPPAVLAQIPQSTLVLRRQPEETYESFLNRAESLASDTISQHLFENPNLSDFRLVIIGEDQGAIAPLFSLDLTRQRWTFAPQIQRWATYFPESKLLLGFEDSKQ